MNQTSCPQETAVCQSARLGEWGEALRAHVASCPVCKEVVQTSLWMRSLAQGLDGELPDAALLWRRAHMSKRLGEKQAEVERTRNLIEWLEEVSLVVGSIGVACWAIWNRDALEAALTWFSPQVLMTIYDAVSSTPLAFWSVVGALCFIATALAYPIWGQD
jgi:hypothetical protein